MKISPPNSNIFEPKPKRSTKCLKRKTFRIEFSYSIQRLCCNNHLLLCLLHHLQHLQHLLRLQHQSLLNRSPKPMSPTSTPETATRLNHSSANSGYTLKREVQSFPLLRGK